MNNQLADRESNASSSHENDIDSDDEESSFAGTSVDPKQSEIKQVQHLSRWETLGVRFWRTIVLVLLIIAGVLVSVGTYIFLSEAEQNDATNRYFLFTHTISDATAFHITNMQEGVRSLSETITAGAIAMNESFPFVTTPVFEVHGAHAREQSGIEAISYSPLVTVGNQDAWANYSVTKSQWLADSRQYLLHTRDSLDPAVYQNGNVTPYIWQFDEDGRRVHTSGRGPFFPVWTSSPPPFSPDFINYNTVSQISMKVMYPVVSLAREGVFGEVQNLAAIAATAVSPQDHVIFHQRYGANVTTETVYLHPHSIMLTPVLQRLNDPDSDIVGLLHSVVAWDRYLSNLLPKGVDGILCVLSNTCGQEYTYVLKGSQATYLGEGDLHDKGFDNTEVAIPLYDYVHPNTTPKVLGHCEYTLRAFASVEYTQGTTANTPVVFTAVVAVTFLLVVVTFIVYDAFVQRRNSLVVDAAARSNAILSSLFPQNVRDRLFANEAPAPSGKSAAAGVNRLRSFLDNDAVEALADSEGLGYEGKPIADLFPETTIMFADIAGFTAWSSVREPAQVFTLLETLYRAFDEVAKRRRVFKVETVGDCYVAVTGLPDPRRDHAVAMARFARDCMFKARQLTKKLEIALGPDTADLCLRAGLHSGPVTAGVLRGERSRFQLFGDTMNTASRMESTGIKGKIQISQETADYLIAAGKSAWLTLREEKVMAKGKGEMQTYWLLLGEQREHELSGGSHHSSEDDDDDDDGEDTAEVKEAKPQQGVPDEKAVAMANAKTTRLVEWNVDVLLRLLKQIVARRKALGLATSASGNIEAHVKFCSMGKTTITEVKEIITLPKFNSKMKKQDAPDAIALPPQVVDQLYDYVSNIAAIYNENPFHNFEHASHVTMSVVKLLSRIVAPSDVENEGKTLHDHTYGITSDPLTQFACVFSALIHDADHQGVPNMQLVKEKTAISEFYKGKSVAEQNSVDLAWHLLMDDAYADLRHTIYTTDSELKRFRQLVVNSVMATDIVDKELKELRNSRWAKAFSETAAATDATKTDDINRKATIVIEHLIQASDVAHTMQHWHIYRKWNERFFLECCKAFEDGRADKHPADNWYEGEIGFFDFYIIPLAKKLKECGVFGVSSDEYLNYAVKNRKEWEERGREVVVEMLEKVSKGETA